MSEYAQNINQEFWRPPVPGVAVPEVRTQPETCSRCSTEFVVGARFCYVCGMERESELEVSGASITRFLDLRLICNALGLTVGSLIAFVIGIVCIAAAIAVGFMYTASTVLDWQAVQVWRIEWLLAAAVALIAGILLKRSAA